MRTKEEIIEAIGRLKEASPEEGMEVFAPLEEAVTAYYTASGELGQTVGECAFQVALNQEYRNTIFVHQERMPTFSSNFPKGYKDVRELFDGGGAWQEIEEIDEQTFVDAFEFPAGAAEGDGEGGASESDTGGDDGEGGEEEKVRNPYIEDWTARVEASREAIVPGLKAIIAFCESNAINQGLAVYFEEHGGIKSALKHRKIADIIYITGGYKEIIEIYNLDVFIPSYLRT